MGVNNISTVESSVHCTILLASIGVCTTFVRLMVGFLFCGGIEILKLAYQFFSFLHCSSLLMLRIPVVS